MRDCRFIFGPDRMVTTSLISEDVECGGIAQDEKIALLSAEVVPLTEGLSWIILSIDPKDGSSEIEYYQSPGDKIQGPQWMRPFYVVNRELLLLTSKIEVTSRQVV